MSIVTVILKLMGETLGGISVYLSQQLAYTLRETTEGIFHLVGQIDSLAGVVLQNRRALDLLTVSVGGICTYLKKECCFYINKRRKILTHLKAQTNLSPRSTKYLPGETLSSLKLFICSCHFEVPLH